MRDTEPFTTSRLQVKVLALPVKPAAHITMHRSPEVTSAQSGADIDGSGVGLCSRL